MLDCQRLAQMSSNKSYSTYGEGTRSITGCSPASTPVETHPLIRNNFEQATATEGLGVCLTLDLQDIQGEQNNLSDTDQAETSRVSKQCPRAGRPC